MDQVALRLEPSDGWTYLGGDGAAKKPLEVVVRAFGADVLFTSGSAAEHADGEPVTVPVGEGRRLSGRHFFARPAAAANCLITYRGV